MKAHWFLLKVHSASLAKGVLLNDSNWGCKKIAHDYIQIIHSSLMAYDVTSILLAANFYIYIAANVNGPYSFPTLRASSEPDHAFKSSPLVLC